MLSQTSKGWALDFLLLGKACNERPVSSCEIRCKLTLCSALMDGVGWARASLHPSVLVCAVHAKTGGVLND
jgi:hypothetical protein